MISKEVLVRGEPLVICCFEDKRVVVRISTIFILVKFECRDLGRDSGTRIAADAESRSVHGGGASVKIPY